MQIGVLKIGAIVKFQIEEVVVRDDPVTMNEEERECRGGNALDEGQQEAQFWSYDHIVDHKEVQEVAR